MSKSTRFEWDEAKAVSNLKTHGIGFDIAVRAFADPFALFDLDGIEGGDERWQSIAKSMVGSVAGGAHDQR